jgi:uncharacterized protein (DUF885 family)
MAHRQLWLALAFTCALGSIVIPVRTISADSYEEIIASRGKTPDPTRLEELIALYLRDRRVAPTVSVVNGQQARWMSRAVEVAAARQRAPLALAALNSIAEETLPAPAKLEWRFLKHVVKAEEKLAPFPGEYLEPWPSTGLQQIPATLPRESAADYDVILTWLRGVPLQMQESIDLMRRGLAQGVTARRAIVEPTLAFTRSLSTADPLSTRSLSAFKSLPSSLPAARQKELTESAVDIYRTAIVPAYLDWIRFVETTYLPAVPAFPRMNALPNGEAWYAAMLWSQSGIDGGPAEIERAALADVRRTQNELEAIARGAGFTGTYNQFVIARRAQPQCAALDAEGIRTRFRELMQQVEAGLPKLFATIPTIPYEVVPGGPNGSTALGVGSATPGSLAEGRPGRIAVQEPYLNGGCGFDAVMLHEAVPGHIFQQHIVVEHAQKTMSALRRQALWERRVFSEGWATYATSLASELGVRLDAQSKASGQMFMAARTATETGIHLRGWTRDEAIVFYRKTLGWDPPQESASVIDRLAADPGQGVAYFVGQQKIAALRARAEKELGPRFDVRQFHDEILRNGPLPFDVIEAQVDDWIAARRNGL